MNILDQNLKQSLIKGYISEKEESKLELLPEFLTNDADSNQKVLTTIIKELQNCEEFWFSVAFITTSGVATSDEYSYRIKKAKYKRKNCSI